MTKQKNRIVTDLDLLPAGIGFAYTTTPAKFLLSLVRLKSSGVIGGLKGRGWAGTVLDVEQSSLNISRFARSAMSG